MGSMHDHHMAHAAPWTLYVALVLSVCVIVSLGRLLVASPDHAAAPASGYAGFGADRDSDVAHLSMNAAMLAMLLDTGMVYGHLWLPVTVGIAGILAGRLAWRIRRGHRAHETSNAPLVIHVLAALVMIYAVQTMRAGATGGILAIVLAAVVSLDVLATTLLLVAGRAPVPVVAGGLPESPTARVAVRHWRTATVPHIGMGVGMLAMLIGP